MLTAVALRRPRHFVGLAAVVPTWLRSLRDPDSAKRANRSDEFPGELGGTELRGMLAGPIAYLRARMDAKALGGVSAMMSDPTVNRDDAVASETTSEFRPIKLAMIDVESCPESIAASGYAAVWALVREHGRPRGMIRVDFTDGVATREQLSAAIETLPAAPRPPESERTLDRDLPSISVVIPSLLARADGLDACLRSLAAFDYPDYEVIVVDNRAAGAAEVRLPGVRVVRETRPGISAARNRGLAEATGEIDRVHRRRRRGRPRLAAGDREPLRRAPR